MDISSEEGLSLIESKTFAQQIRPELVRCCPTMDLVAYVTSEEKVEVYRFGGQRAFMIQRKDGAFQVQSLCWKYNGSFHEQATFKRLFLISYLANSRF
jgi:anaphase-promoting complex subunit 4